MGQSFGLFFYLPTGSTPSLTHSLTELKIRQKSESQKGGCKKTKHAQFSEKLTFLTPWYLHVRVRIRGQEMFVFLENLACFVFLLPPSGYLPTSSTWSGSKSLLLNNQLRQVSSFSLFWKGELQWEEMVNINY